MEQTPCSDHENSSGAFCAAVLGRRVRGRELNGNSLLLKEGEYIGPDRHRGRCECS